MGVSKRRGRVAVKPARLTLYDGANAEAAALILGDVDAHGGPESLPCRWARLVVERGGLFVHSSEMPQPEQGVLFETSEVANV